MVVFRDEYVGSDTTAKLIYVIKGFNQAVHVMITLLFTF